MKLCPKCGSVMNYEQRNYAPDEGQRDGRGWYVPKLMPSNNAASNYKLGRYKCSKCDYYEDIFE
jgi:ribosomal protein S27AE